VDSSPPVSLLSTRAACSTQRWVQTRLWLNEGTEYPTKSRFLVSVASETDWTHECSLLPFSSFIHADFFDHFVSIITLQTIITNNFLATLSVYFIFISPFILIVMRAVNLGHDILSKCVISMINLESS